jgi:hypothetical protein
MMIKTGLVIILSLMSNLCIAANYSYWDAWKDQVGEYTNTTINYYSKKDEQSHAVLPSRPIVKVRSNSSKTKVLTNPVLSKDLGEVKSNKKNKQIQEYITISNEELAASGGVIIGGAAIAVGTTALLATTTSVIPIAVGVVGGAAVGSAVAIASPFVAVGVVGGGLGFGTSATIAGGTLGTFIGGTTGGIASALGLAATAPVWAIPVVIGGTAVAVGSGVYLIYDNYSENKVAKDEKTMITPPINKNDSSWESFKITVGGTLYEIFN